jgi:hypothetical protein
MNDALGAMTRDGTLRRIARQYQRAPLARGKDR